MTELREQFAVEGTPQASGRFEIFAITAGKGNRWQFSAEVLRKSLALWDGAEVFVNHSADLTGRDVRDLGGVLSGVTWDDAAQGVKLQLTPVGPSAALVRELGFEMLSEGTPKPKVGFSADIGFTADGERVKEILRVFSVDLVFDPARGGAFVRALNSVQQEQEGGHTGTALTKVAANAAGGNMKDREGVEDTRATAADAAENKDLAAVRDLLNVTQEQAKLAQEVEAARQVRAQMCDYLLDSGLAASKLPQAVQTRIRKQFAGKVFDASELQGEIEDARKMVTELTGGASVAGLRSMVSQMFSSDDQLRLAVEDLFQVERVPKEKGLQVARLSGIKELYLGMTGAHDAWGGIEPERARFQATTTTFAGLVKNALNKALVNHWVQLGRAGYSWWEKIVHVEHFDSLNSITWVIFGTVGSLPTVAEGAEYSELKIGDSPETSSFIKYGGFVGVTREAIDRDETRKLRAVPRELASAGLRNISSLVAAIFTDNSGVGPTLADTGALFNSTAVTTAGGHKNLLTTALSTDYTAWNTVAAAMYNQPLLIANETGYYGTGKKMAVDPKFCLVPRALKGQAEALFIPRWGNPIDTVQAAGGSTYGGYVEPITVPEWTDADDWAAVADPMIVPGICVGERFGLIPQIVVAGDETSPAVFMNDESRFKVRHYVAVGVADYRPLHKSNV